MLVKNLKVLHMEKPLAIDVVPYFSWMMESDIPNTMQESYQLTIKDTAYMTRGLLKAAATLIFRIKEQNYRVK